MASGSSPGPGQGIAIPAAEPGHDTAARSTEPARPAEPGQVTAIRTAGHGRPGSTSTDTALLVVFFSDMKGSTALKEDMTERWDEGAFQRLRQEHDALLTEVITLMGATSALPVPSTPTRLPGSPRAVWRGRITAPTV